MGVLNDPRSRKTLFVFLLCLVVVNLPFAHAAWTNWRIDREGVDVVATVVDARNLGTQDRPRLYVEYRFDPSIDPTNATWATEVKPEVYERASDTKEIAVRVLKGDPRANTAEGEVRRYAGLYVIALVDLFIIAIIVLWWRYRLARDAVRDTARSGDRGTDAQTDSPSDASDSET